MIQKLPVEFHSWGAQLKDLPIGQEFLIKTFEEPLEMSFISITNLGNGLVKERVVEGLGHIYQFLDNKKTPVEFIRFTQYLIAMKSTVNKYSLRFEKDSFRFLSNDLLEYSYVVRVKYLSELLKIGESFISEVFTERDKLLSEVCKSINLETPYG